MPPKPTSYTFVHVDGGSAARLQCYRCDETVTVSVKPRSSREYIGKLFRAKGWDFDEHTTRLCLCPAHAKRKKGKAHEPDTPEPEHNPMTAPLREWVETINEQAEVVQPVAPEPSAPEGPEEEMKQVFDIAPTPAAEPVDLMPTPIPAPNVRPLTPAEKSKVRDKLDLHYDTDRCCYINGWSDQKIGSDAKVPWAAVAQMREMAYGPLLVDPETEALTDEVKRLDAQIEEGNNQLIELMTKLDDLMTKMDGLKKQAGNLQKQIDALALTRRK